MNTLQQHINEYRKQLETAQRQVIALTGAIQALTNFQEALQNADSDQELGDTECSGSD